MPELPDVEIYVDQLRARVIDVVLDGARVLSPFLTRSVDPPVSALLGKRVVDVRRLGKRIVLGFEEDLFAVIHLMVAGRFRWEKRGFRPPRKIGLAAFDLAPGCLVLTEASAKKRASLHVLRGAAALAAHDPGGLEVLDSSLAAFADRLRAERHTLKRSLTDPHLFSGIGNAYSDEILHAARLSPVQMSTNLSDEEVARLHAATRATLAHWLATLREQFGARFPGRGEVTAFRDDFAVHGRYAKPCPACATPVQRIRYAENETNYCPTCQTDGRLLADRSLSRLLKQDWPRSLDEMEERLRRD